MASVQAAPDLKTQLTAALDGIVDAEPSELFAARYQLLPERDGGGQSVVAFARDARGGMMQYAIKCAFASLSLCPPCEG